MSRYSNAVFNVTNIAAAKAIILTPLDSTTEQRWTTETPYLGSLIQDHLGLAERHRVLDFGCGIGRLAKEMIHRSGCSVVGVDTSTTMRAFAPVHVLSERFLACPPGMLEGEREMDHAIAVWSLQHVPEITGAIALIHKHLKSFGKLLVVNDHARCLPMSDGPWMDDKKDVRELLCARFEEIHHGALDPERTTPATAKNAWWGVYKRRS